MNLIMPRTIYTPISTIGNLLINNQLFCHTLEDTVRPQGSGKVFGRTAIPAGRRRVIVSMSPKFKKLMPEILDVPQFTGIRIHNGLNPDHTLGCILTGKNIVNSSLIDGSMGDELTALLLSSKEEHWIEIIDTYPYNGMVG